MTQFVSFVSKLVEAKRVDAKCSVLRKQILRMQKQLLRGFDRLVEMSNNDPTLKDELLLNRNMIAECFKSLDESIVTDAEYFLIDHAIRKYVKAETWGEKKAVLDHYPELLTEVVDVVFQNMIDDEEDLDVSQILEHNYDLLFDCRHDGIDAAFAKAIHNEISAALQKFLSAQSFHEKRQIIEENPSLLEPWIDDYFQDIMEINNENTTALELIENNRLLLNLCREHGFHTVFDELDHLEDARDPFSHN